MLFRSIALVCKAGELIGLWLAVAIGWPDQIGAWTVSAKELMREGRRGASQGRTHGGDPAVRKTGS